MTARPVPLRAAVLGVAIWGPGLEGWAASRAVLAGGAPYVPGPSPAPPPAILSATERRRTGPVVRLALAVAQDAAAMSGLPPGELRSVFGSSNGDGPVVGSILDALTASGATGTATGVATGQARLVSPTQFHNSVHNAAAGYWSIATGSAQPATCLGCHDDTWAASLLTAMAAVVADNAAVLLCVYDHPLTPPLDAKRPTAAPFGAALVLAPSGAGAPVADITVTWSASPGVLDLPGAPALQLLAKGNPAARSLRLLELLAGGGGGACVVPYLDGHLAVSMQPWSPASH